MQWTEEQEKRAAEVYGRIIGGGGTPKQALAAVMELAVREVAALGGAMTAEALAESLAFMGDTGPENGNLPHMAKAFRVHCTAQGVRVAALESEIARLKPSGQVAEDVARLTESLSSEMGLRLTPEDRDALARLAAKAQGYTQAVAERDKAWSERAAAIAEKHAAVSDNAALLVDREIVAHALGTFLPEESREWSFLMHRSDRAIWGDKVCASVGDDEAGCNCPGTEQGRRVQAALPVLRRLDEPHPGAALLERSKHMEQALQAIEQVGSVRGGMWCAGQAIRALAGQPLLPLDGTLPAQSQGKGSP